MGTMVGYFKHAGLFNGVSCGAYSGIAFVKGFFVYLDAPQQQTERSLLLVSDS